MFSQNYLSNNKLNSTQIKLKPFYGSFLGFEKLNPLRNETNLWFTERVSSFVQRFAKTSHKSNLCDPFTFELLLCELLNKIHEINSRFRING